MRKDSHFQPFKVSHAHSDEANSSALEMIESGEGQHHRLISNDGRVSNSHQGNNIQFDLSNVDRELCCSRDAVIVVAFWIVMVLCGGAVLTVLIFNVKAYPGK